MTPTAINHDPALHASEFYTTMLAEGWQPVYMLDGRIPKWRHRNGTELELWRDWYRHFVVSGETPPPF
jgi:hypothetical protein